MTIKSRISLYISVFFSIFFGVLSYFIIYNFSDYRREEFRERLRARAYSGIRMMIDMRKADDAMFALVDSTSGRTLYDERILIFDSTIALRYSSVRDTPVIWSADEIRSLRQTSTFLKDMGDNDVYGLYYKDGVHQYYALVSANDVFGKRKLQYLILLVIISSVIFIVATWVFTFLLVKRQLQPIDDLYGRMNAINDLNIYQDRPLQHGSDNEVDLLDAEFNLMMNRIAEVYHQQKDFTAHVSHELRTPLLRLSAKLENKLLQAEQHEADFLRGMLDDITRINELIEALLLLTSAGRETGVGELRLRIDEAVFQAVENVSKQYPDLHVELSVDERIMQSESHLTVTAQSSWMEIVFSNLLRNAYLYSSDKKVRVDFGINEQGTFIDITNAGSTLSEVEQQRLFQPFMRGSNAQHVKGLGIGLTIVNRILTALGFHIEYIAATNVNTFRVYL